MNLPADINESIATARARVRAGFPWWLRPFVARGVVGITLGRRVYLAAGVAMDRMEELIRHELAHVRQVNELGLIRFHARYLAEYVRHRRAGLSSAEAYSEISFEREARAAERGPQGMDV